MCRGRKSVLLEGSVACSVRAETALYVRVCLCEPALVFGDWQVGSWERANGV